MQKGKSESIESIVCLKDDTGTHKITFILVFLFNRGLALNSFFSKLFFSSSYCSYPPPKENVAILVIIVNYEIAPLLFVRYETIKLDFKVTFAALDRSCIWRIRRCLWCVGSCLWCVGSCLWSTEHCLGASKAVSDALEAASSAFEAASGALLSLLRL